MKTKFEKKYTDLKLFNVYCYKINILNQCCAFLFLLIKESWKKISQVSNTNNKSELHKMYFKVY